PGLGGGPLASVFDYSKLMNDPTNVFNDVFVSFNAFDPNSTSGLTSQVLDPSGAWKNGLRVAAADVNGDGRQAVVVAPCKIGQPDVRVFDAMSLAILDDFFAFSASFRGGVFVGGGH